VRRVGAGVDANRRQVGAQRGLEAPANVIGERASARRGRARDRVVGALGQRRAVGRAHDHDAGPPRQL
jgi:hypothetical protein